MFKFQISWLFVTGVEYLIRLQALLEYSTRCAVALWRSLRKYVGFFCRFRVISCVICVYGRKIHIFKLRKYMYVYDCLANWVWIWVTIICWCLYRDCLWNFFIQILMTMKLDRVYKVKLMYVYVLCNFILISTQLVSFLLFLYIIIHSWQVDRDREALS